MFDNKFFLIALDRRPIIASDAKKEAAKVIERIANAFDALYSEKAA